MLFLSFIEPIFAWNVPLYLQFSWEISSLFYPIIFLYVSTCSLKKAFLFLLAILWNSGHSVGYIFPFLFFLLLPFFSQLFVTPPQKSLCLLEFLFLWMVWSQCYKLPSIVLQALHLPDLIPLICLSFPLYKESCYVIPEWLSCFPYFLQFKPGICNKKLWSKPQSAPGLFLLTV